MVERDDAEIVAAVIVRLAVAHYLAGDDQATFLAQLRHAAGIQMGDRPDR
ncbi:hypothetical protein ACRS5S_20465 [Nocardia asiatica]